MKVALLDPQTGKGSVASMPVKLPDYEVEDMTLSPLLVLRDVQEAPAIPLDALSAFQLGPMRFVPHYGNVFSTQDSITLLTFIYNPKVDEATTKPSMTASFAILKDGKPVAKAEDQSYDTQGAGPSVGPVPLAKFTPGKYVAQVKVKDNVAKKDLSEEVTFEVK
jgi:hypothetical protein